MDNRAVGTDRVVVVKVNIPNSPNISVEPVAGSPGVVTRMQDRRRTLSKSDKPNLEADLELLTEQLERLKQHLDELPEVDATRVIQIYNRVQAGDYKVDASKVAAKLMALESSLDNSQPE